MSAACKTEAYSIVFPTVFFSLSQIAIHSLLPQIIIELVCLTDSDGIDCDNSAVSGKSSLINLISSCIINIPCILMIGFYASFAGRYGLKPTLLSPVLGNFLFLTCIAIARYSKFHYSVIMFGSLLSGISGGRNSFMMATFAYAADVTSPKERSDVFSVIESSIYCAKIFCPFTIGIVSKKYGFGLSTLMGMSFCFINIIWIVFAMKDHIADFDNDFDIVNGSGRTSRSTPGMPLTSPTKKKLIYNEDGIFHDEEIILSYGAINKDINFYDNGDHPIDNFPSGRMQKELAFHPFATFFGLNKLWNEGSIGNSAVPFISSIYFLYHMIAVGAHVIEILFMKYKLNWDPYYIGLFGSIHGLMETMSMVVTPLIATHLLRLEMTDIKWIEIGLWAKFLFFLLFGLVTNTVELFLTLFVLIFCGPVVPRIRSYLSKSVDSKEQNELFAALAALDAISAFLSPIFTAMYYGTVSYYPGFVFEIISFLFVLSALVILFVRRRLSRTLLDVLSVAEAAA